jgi:hypothetical protein
MFGNNLSPAVHDAFVLGAAVAVNLQLALDDVYSSNKWRGVAV